MPLVSVSENYIPFKTSKICVYVNSRTLDVAAVLQLYSELSDTRRHREKQELPLPFTITQ